MPPVKAGGVVAFAQYTGMGYRCAILSRVFERRKNVLAPAQHWPGAWWLRVTGLEPCDGTRLLVPVARLVRTIAHACSTLGRNQ
jgi:hypothetical protein